MLRRIEALNRIPADDFIFTNNNGVVLNRAQYISGNLKAQDMTLEIPANSEDVRVRLRVEAAMLTKAS